MRKEYLVPVFFTLGCLSSSASSENAREPLETSLLATVAVEEPLVYDGVIPAARVDLSAYYFFISETSSEEACGTAVANALSSLSLENKIGEVYLPEFQREKHPSIQVLPASYTSVASQNPALQFSGWQDDLTPRLNGVVYNRNPSPMESAFFNPLGDATFVREDWTNKGYAVVTPAELHDSFVAFANEQVARPMMQVYVCDVTSSLSPN